MAHPVAAYSGAVVLMPLLAFGQPTTGLTQPMTFLRTTAVRWMNGRQQPGFTPMYRQEQRVTLVSVTPDTSGQGRIFAFTFPQQFGQSGTARVVTDLRGRVLQIRADLAERKLPRAALALITPAQQLRWAIFDGVEEIAPALPAARVWDLVPVVDTGSLRARQQWTDTVDLSTSLEGYRQTLSGIRTNTVLGDSVVDGTRLWVVRDSASVAYAERVITDDTTLDTSVVIERSTRGTVVGRYLFDPQLRLFRWRVDTTHLIGEARLEYPDGRVFATPATFDRTSRIDVLDAAYQALLARRQDSLAAGFSIVARPEGNAERVARGDTSALNAVLDTLARSHDPEARGRAAGMLMWVGDPTVRRRASALILTAGDTTSALKALSEKWRFGQVDSADVALELPVLADPARAFAYGIDRDEVYSGPAVGFVKSPPAIASDPAHWPCTPAACRLVAAQWGTPVDRRLRDIALIARVTMEPKVWSDTVLTLWKAGDHFLDDAANLVRGVAATWPAGSKAPIPGSDADWHAWSIWMDGSALSGFGDQRTLVRFQDEHRVVVQFAQRLTGRDFAAEWRRKMEESTDDTTQMVFGEMLAELGAMSEDTSAIVGRVRASSPLLQSLGADEVVALFKNGGAVAPLAIESQIQDSVLAMAIDSAAPWPPIGGSTREIGMVLPRKVVQNVDRAYGPPYPAPGQLIVIGDSIAESVRAKWSKRGIRFAPSPVEVPSNEGAVELVISAVHIYGPFAKISITQSHLGARVNGRGQSWAAGGTVYLMRSDTGWVVIASRSWIT